MRLGASALLLMMLGGLLAGSASAFSYFEPTMALSGAAGAGYVYISLPCSFASWTSSATGGLIDFWGFSMNSTVWPRMGLSCDTVGESMTLNHITSVSLGYTSSGASHQRLWCPDLGAPANVTGATYTFDSTWQVVDLDTAGAGDVLLQWSAAPTPAPSADESELFLLGGVSCAALLFLAAALRRG